MDKCGASGATGDHRRQQRALRLIFEQRGDELKLVSTQRLNMVVPPPQALVPKGDTRGSWFELRDGEVLVPLAAHICTEIDPEAKRIVIDPPEGLLELNAKSG